MKIKESLPGPHHHQVVQKTMKIKESLPGPHHHQVVQKTMKIKESLPGPHHHQGQTRRTDVTGTNWNEEEGAQSSEGEALGEEVPMKLITRVLTEPYRMY
ncbi:unnamed protein product [Arctogadus glacialis]